MDIQYPDWGKQNFILTRSFALAGVTYAAIDFRIPNGNDLIKFSSNTKPFVERLLGLAVDLSSLDENVFRAMHSTDYAGVVELLSGFIMPAPKTSTDVSQIFPPSSIGT
eukprot:gene7618-7682_t